MHIDTLMQNHAHTDNPHPFSTHTHTNRNAHSHKQTHPTYFLGYLIVKGNILKGKTKSCPFGFQWVGENTYCPRTYCSNWLFSLLSWNGMEEKLRKKVGSPLMVLYVERDTLPAVWEYLVGHVFSQSLGTPTVSVFRYVGLFT